MKNEVPCVISFELRTTTKPNELPRFEALITLSDGVLKIKNIRPQDLEFPLGGATPNTLI